MRVVIAHSHLDQLGGGERCTLELSRYLSRRHEVALWTGPQPLSGTFSELADFPRRRLTPLEWFTARPQADAVIAQTFGSYTLAFRHPNVVCYLHTLRSRYLTGGVRPDLLARRWVDRRALAHARTVLTNSAYTAGRAVTRYGRRPEVIPPGVDETLFACPPRAGEYSLFVGRLAPEKGLERLLAWMEGARTRLRIVGAGEAGYVRYLRSLATAHVEFLGPLAGEALTSQYAGCRFLSFLPENEEFGLATLEAMAAGKPVVALRSGALPELADDGATGLLVSSPAEFAAAVHRLLDDDALCLRMGAAGREKARAFTWQRFARGVEDACLRGTARQAG